MNWLYRFLLVFICFIIVKNDVSASHLAGGEMSYRYLGNNQYAFTLTLFQDCLTGEPAAIEQDAPAIIGVFRGSSNTPIQVLKTPLAGSMIIPPEFSNECVNNPPAKCLRGATFNWNLNLPPSPEGYRIVYQRCCRNQGIVNIVSPFNVGSTFYATVPPNTTNNSAKFKNYPSQIICINNPYVYDHSATDADGDSLSYELCYAYEGGSINDPKPERPFNDFTPVRYQSPYTYLNPMMGDPGVRIDAKTGLLTALPTLEGLFVVTVCCNEWRNGVKISTTSREYQFRVTNCSKAVVANIPILTNEPNTYIANCKDFNVFFKNTSEGATSYEWDFGDPTTTNDVSNDFQPSYTYPDTGTYVVKLVINKGSTCSDSISRLVKVYPKFNGDFTINGNLCPNNTIELIDNSVSTFPPVNYWKWNMSNGVQIEGESTANLKFDKGGDYKVTLISGDQMGCTDTTIKTIQIDHFTPYAGADTTIFKGQYIEFSASGGDYYTWTPSDNLNNPNIRNPIGTFNNTGEFNYNVKITSEKNCAGEADIKVKVVEKPEIFVPTAFSPNGDGLNDRFNIRTIGYKEIKEFRVFNRFGEMVFESKNFRDSWDGYFKGKPVPIGVYVWYAKLIDHENKEQIVKGDVTVIR